MNKKEYDPSLVQKVSIDEVFPNDYNPKKKDTKEYKDVVRSIKLNGLKQPIFVREENGNYIIVDGEQRYTAAKELGYEEIYIYNLGEISVDEAKALTIWLEVQVPFDMVELGPIAVGLDKAGIELPFSQEKIKRFEMNLASPLDLYSEEGLDSLGERFKTLRVRMTREQFDIVHENIVALSEDLDVSEGRALELLVANKMSGEEQGERDS